MTVIVKKLGGSMAIVIPKSVAREMELREGTPLEISSAVQAMILRKQSTRPRRLLNQLVKQMNRAAYRRHNREFSNDRPVGKEPW